MRRFDVGERRARLARRHRLAPGHRAPDVVAATDAMVCLHATDPATVYLSAWARVDGLATADVDKALHEDRSLVKHLCMRRTLFVLATDLLGVVQAAASARVADRERRRLAKEVQLGAEPELPPEEQARAELVSRWLRTFGPATVADVKWWLGSTVAATRAALAAAGAVEVDLHGRPGVALADDLDPVEPGAPWAALLPGLDPTTMGWFERDWYLGPHRAAIFDSTGNGGMTAWWDGRIVGGWNQTAAGEVCLQLLEDVGADARAALEAEAARLTAWLDGLRVAPRFPSPLSTAGSRRAR